MEKTKRLSNFELLRVLAIIMIILVHIQIHGPQPILTADNEWFALPKIYRRLFLFEFGIPLGIIGNCLFMLISGYFMNANDHIDTGKISRKLLLQLGFATLVLMIAYCVWINFFWDETRYWETATMGLFNNDWWFVGYYLIVIVIARVFLNNFTAKLTRTQFCSLLFTLLAVTEIGWTGRMLDSLMSEFRTLFIGVFFFLAGGYIARYNPFRKVRAYTFFLIIAATYGIRFLSAYNILSKSIDDYFKSASQGNFIQSVQGVTNYDFTVVILALCIFELFRRWRIPYNRIINFLGKSSLMTYFIHENTFFQSFYRNDCWMEALERSWVEYVCKWLQWTALAFALGLLAYSIYVLLGRLLPKMKRFFCISESQ